MTYVIMVSLTLCASMLTNCSVIGRYVVIGLSRLLIMSLMLSSVSYSDASLPRQKSAPAITFQGEILQGALVNAVTDAKAVRVFNKRIEPDGSGRFVFGLGRDTPKILTIVLIDAFNHEYKHPLAVKQRSYSIQRIEGVDKKYVSPPAETLARIRRENKLISKARAMYSEYDFYRADCVMPAAGPISGVYGSQRVFNGVPKRPHFGLDIANDVGTPVYAPLEGFVSLVHTDMYYSGGTLIMDHGRGVSSTFIHLHKIHVKPGQRVKQGEFIAEIGASGRATGPHLDWRVNWFNQRLDPALLVP